MMSRREDAPCGQFDAMPTLGTSVAPGNGDFHAGNTHNFGHGTLLPKATDFNLDAPSD
jgi:hypothetical protein